MKAWTNRAVVKEERPFQGSREHHGASWRIMEVLFLRHISHFDTVENGTAWESGTAIPGSLCFCREEATHCFLNFMWGKW